MNTLAIRSTAWIKRTKFGVSYNCCKVDGSTIITLSYENFFTFFIANISRSLRVKFLLNLKFENGLMKIPRRIVDDDITLLLRIDLSRYQCNPIYMLKMEKKCFILNLNQPKYIITWSSLSPNKILKVSYIIIKMKHLAEYCTKNKLKKDFFLIFLNNP